MSLSFLKDFKKALSKMETVHTNFGPPSRWYSTGNYALNKVISGAFDKGFPQNRITVLAGEAGAGKSYIATNVIASAQREGAFALILDSENSLDENFLKNVGVDISEDAMQYAGVSTFSDVTKVVSEFITSYEKAYGKDNPSAPPVVILLDSLDMLITDTENAHFESGQSRGDQGQKSKQAKQLLRTIVSRITRIPVAFIMTHQVYPNTDLMNGQGRWIVNNAIRYSASQILLISKGKLKEGTDIIGCNMKIECYKSRFSQPGMKTEVEVPYTSGMSAFSGVVELLVDKGIAVKVGHSYVVQIDDKELKFKERTMTHEIMTKILTHPLLQKEEEEMANLMGSDTGADLEEIINGKQPEEELVNEQ